MTDIRDRRVLYFKGYLFLVTGLLAGGLLLADAPSWRVAILLAVCVWSFCRFYYFAFYVIDHYIEPGSRYAGLWDFTKKQLRGSRAKRPEAPTEADSSPGQH